LPAGRPAELVISACSFIEASAFRLLLALERLQLGCTQAQIDALSDPPDWYPEEHPPMPPVAGIVVFLSNDSMRIWRRLTSKTGAGMRIDTGA
jgi:hypothetical protein